MFLKYFRCQELRSTPSETRDMEAAEHFFAQARTVVGHAPETVTTDGRDAYPRAIRATLGPEVRPSHTPPRFPGSPDKLVNEN